MARHRSCRPTRFPRASSAATRTIGLTLLAVSVMAISTRTLLAQSGAPSRAATAGCTWERASSATAGFAAWVQRCTAGARTIRVYLKGTTLLQEYSDARAAPDTLIESFVLKPNETAEAGVRRLYLAHTNPAISDRCVMAPYVSGNAPTAMKRFTFVPDAAYAKALKAKQDPNDVPEPPCGEWGTAPDGQQFFAVWPTGVVRRLLFVRVGQDAPLFDEMTLQLLPSRR